MGFVKPTAISCALLLGLQQSLKVHAQTTCPDKNDSPGFKSTQRECLDAGCTANDVRVGKLSEPTTTDTCASLTDTITFTSDLEMEVTVGPGRYDLGLYVGTGDTCEVFTFGCDSQGVDDGDGCGDMLGTSGSNGGLNFYTDIEFTVDCNIQGGQLPFPYCTVWDNNVNTECIGPDTVEPGTTSKCKCSEAEIFVPLCVVFIDPDSFEVKLPDTCPAQGDEIVVLIPGDSIVGTFDNEDFLVIVEDSAGTALDQFSYTPGGADIELMFPNVDTELTLKVTNPNYGSCEATQTFTIDCAFCGSHACGTDLISDPTKSATPCNGNVCDDTQCCEPVEKCDETFPCGDEVNTNNGVACDGNVCDASQCCEPVEKCDETFPCGDEVNTNNGVACDGNVCDASQCCEPVEACGTDYECVDGSPINDGVACDGNVCDDDQCCAAGEICGDYVCTTEGNVNNPDAAADICTDECTDDQCCVSLACDTSYGCEEVQGDSCHSPPLTDIEGVSANRWGWYLKPTFDSTDQSFTFDMYAGAGQNDLSSGAFAGNVVVTVNHDGSSDYTVHPADGYCFDDVHLHVGNELPTVNKKKTTPTVAPGKYTQSTLHDGPFYIIVHVGETCTPCGH